MYTLPFYLSSLIFAVYGVDQYTDLEGKYICPAHSTKGFKEATDASVKVYQTGIGLTVVFHSIEFMRQLAFAATALVGTNLIAVYYVLSINVVFGLVALILAIAARFGGAGCAAKQPNRSLYLMLQFIPLVLMVV